MTTFDFDRRDLDMFQKDANEKTKEPMKMTQSAPEKAVERKEVKKPVEPMKIEKAPVKKAEPIKIVEDPLPEYEPIPVDPSESTAGIY